MDIGKGIILIGFGLILVGALIWLAARFGLPFGKLPGDFHYISEHFNLYVPLASSLLISIVLTILINLAMIFLRK